MARFFEKISYQQFKKDLHLDKKEYNKYNLPVRSTIESAGYDFESIIDFVIEPGQTIRIPLGIKACMNDGEVLFIIIRSSIGFKYNVRLCNQVGVIDKDYYNNDKNEGHIWVSIKNEGEKDFVIKSGEKICQGIFLNYLKTDNEEEIVNKRTGWTVLNKEEE